MEGTDGRPGDAPGRGSLADALLASLREARGFDARQLVSAKVGRLTGWFAGSNLDAGVVGLSGGVDSAVVLALLLRAARARRSPIRRVVALSVPIAGRGVTGQDTARSRARLVADALGAELWTVPLADSHAELGRQLGAASGLALDEWTAGQMASVERTPVLYGAAALLQAHGFRSVVVGTTNRDEGAYLGFFGKASDAMVDLQPIADLHKSEVRAMAAELGVPRSVVEAEPSGDVWDGRVDEEMIGATYDQVELVLRMRELGRPLTPRRTDAGAPGAGGESALLEAAARVEQLHGANAHKYRVGAPSVFLDVFPRGVPGGWHDEPFSPRVERAPDDVPGAWEPPQIALDPPTALPAVERRAGARMLEEVLTARDCTTLVSAMERANTVPVGVSGRRESAGVGSHRATAFSPELADALWHRLRPAVPAVRFLGPYDRTEAGSAPADGPATWRVVGLSPLLRFMRYTEGGRHVCHYDAGYDYGDGRRTLSSVVLYLTDATTSDGGATRLIDDGQARVPVWERTHDDWDDDVRPDQVVLSVRPRRGSALVFDHRVPHDVELWLGSSPRVVIRADVVYEAVPDGRTVGGGPQV